MGKRRFIENLVDYLVSGLDCGARLGRGVS